MDEPTTKRRSGYAPRSTSGEPRSKVLAARVDLVERDAIHALLHRHELPANSAGLRDFLLGACGRGTCQHPPPTEFAIAA